MNSEQAENILFEYKQSLELLDLVTGTEISENIKERIEALDIVLKDNAELKVKADKLKEKIKTNIEKHTKELVKIYEKYGASDYDYIRKEKQIETEKQFLKEME